MSAPLLLQSCVPPPRTIDKTPLWECGPYLQSTLSPAFHQTCIIKSCMIANTSSPSSSHASTKSAAPHTQLSSPYLPPFCPVLCYSVRARRQRLQRPQQDPAGGRAPAGRRSVPRRAGGGVPLQRRRGPGRPLQLPELPAQQWHQPGRRLRLTAQQQQ